MKEKTVVAGDIISISLYDVRNAGTRKTTHSSPNTRSRAVATFSNLKTTTDSLTNLINCNFKKGDLFVLFTYKGKAEFTDEQCKKHIRGLINKLKKEYEKNNISFRYIYVKEGGKVFGRIHYHFILPYIEPSIIERCWNRGTIFKKPLYDGDKLPLARYLLKEKKALKDLSLIKNKYTIHQKAMLWKLIYKEKDRINKYSTDNSFELSSIAASDNINPYEAKILNNELKGVKDISLLKPEQQLHIASIWWRILYSMSGKQEKAYRCSKNLKKPLVSIDIIYTDKIRQPLGYTRIKGSSVRFQNDYGCRFYKDRFILNNSNKEE